MRKSPEVSSGYTGETGRACQVLAMWDAGGMPGCVADMHVFPAQPIPELPRPGWPPS